MLSKHFAKHGYIHCFWLIVLLCAACAALIIELPNGDKVNSYLSFASSIASLILAVVAIVYAFVADQGRHETTSLLQSSAENISKGSMTLKELSSKVSEKIDVIIGQVSDIAEPINKIQQTLADRPDSGRNSDLHLNITEGRVEEFFHKSPIQGAALAFYALARTSELQVNKINPYVLYSDTPIFLNAFLGVFESVRCLEPSGIKLERIKTRDASEGISSEHIYNIIEFPSEIRSQILSEVIEGYPDFEKYSDAIDIHINSLVD